MDGTGLAAAPSRAGCRSALFTTIMCPDGWWGCFGPLAGHAHAIFDSGGIDGDDYGRVGMCRERCGTARGGKDLYRRVVNGHAQL